MMHGLCGLSNKNSLCMKDGKSQRHFPKRSVNRTTIDEDGYLIYKCRDNDLTVEKNNVPLDNQYMVPYNLRLLSKYGAHINVEWCNQSRSIKWLFKYVNKGHDQVSVAFYQGQVNESSDQNVDEIKMYYDCRYRSPCEAVWIIFGFDISYRDPAVEKLHFHFPNEQLITFKMMSPLILWLDELKIRSQILRLGWRPTKNI